MTFAEFVAKYNGKSVDYDGAYGVQCVDLVDQYLKDIFGITGVWVSNAREFYTKFYDLAPLVKYFERVANTRNLVAQTGDIVIWGGGTHGHCGIANGQGTIDVFSTYEENTMGKHEPVTLVSHKYAGTTGVDCCNPVLGVLRPKQEYQHLLYGSKNEYNVVNSNGKTIGKLTIFN